MAETLAVVNGAIIKCDKCLSPSALVATSAPHVGIAARPVATIADNEPSVNVLPFGICAKKKAPCVPVTPSPWIPGGTGIPIASPFPILTKASILPCVIGGIIEVVDAGQTFFLVDEPTAAKALVQDFLDDWRASINNDRYSWTGSDFAFGVVSGLMIGNTQGNLRAAERLLNEQKIGRLAGKLSKGLGVVGYIPDGMSVINKATHDDYEGAAVTAVSAGIGGYAATVCTGWVVSAATGATVGSDGLATPLAIAGGVAGTAGCGAGGAAVSSGTEWVYYDVAKPVGGAAAHGARAVAHGASAVSDAAAHGAIVVVATEIMVDEWIWKHKNPLSWG